ncbi:MAG: DUF58 domain-containing protein [Candidatus Nanopelagicales bacterium]
MTRWGRVLLLAGVLLAGIGWLIDNRMWIALGVSALSLVAAVRVALGRVPRVTCQVRYPKHEVHAGEDARIELQLLLDRNAWLSKRLRVDAGTLEPVWTDIRRVGSPGTAQIVLPTQRRGRLQVPPIRITNGDPWRLFERVAARADGMELLVYPRIRSVMLPDLHGQLDAQSMDTRYGEDEFHALREYVLGDEPRRIHWRSSARLGQLMVRQHVAASGSKLVLLLDNRAVAYGRGEADAEAAFDVAVERTVGVVQALAQRGLEFALLSGDAAVTVAHSGGQSLEPVMRALAVVQTSTGSSETFRDELRKLRASTVIAISPEPHWALQHLPHQLKTVWVDARDFSVMATA